jgi:PIN domain nuclease of toxin-antitoxin system
LWWFARESRLSPAQHAALSTAGLDRPCWVSDISLWEIATLHQLGRIRLELPLRDWLEAATAPPLVRRIGISPAIVAATASLPKTFHRDPADRILVASAQVLGLTLVTQDAALIAAGLVPTLT